MACRPISVEKSKCRGRFLSARGILMRKSRRDGRNPSWREVASPRGSVEKGLLRLNAFASVRYNKIQDSLTYSVRISACQAQLIAVITAASQRARRAGRLCIPAATTVRAQMPHQRVHGGCALQNALT